MILVWGAQRRIITGSDLLGRLLRGIATVEKPAAAQAVTSEASPPAATAVLAAASQQTQV
jgi:hypothetical protein